MLAFSREFGINFGNQYFFFNPPLVKKLNLNVYKAEDRQLIKELSKNGKGRMKEVLFIIREGANPNAVTKNGLSMLHTALKNRHFECIPVLLKEKADIEKKMPG